MCEMKHSPREERKNKNRFSSSKQWPHSSSETLLIQRATVNFSQSYTARDYSGTNRSKSSLPGVATVSQESVEEKKNKQNE